MLRVLEQDREHQCNALDATLEVTRERCQELHQLVSFPFPSYFDLVSNPRESR